VFKSIARSTLKAWPIVLVVVLLGGVAIANIPDSDGIIHGCYKKSGGALRVIDPSAGQSCTARERPLPWNQQPAVAVWPSFAISSVIPTSGTSDWADVVSSPPLTPLMVPGWGATHLLLDFTADSACIPGFSYYLRCEIRFVVDGVPVSATDTAFDSGSDPALPVSSTHALDLRESVTVSASEQPTIGIQWRLDSTGATASGCPCGAVFVFSNPILTVQPVSTP
jgi:hypothetical protein